MEKQEKDVGSGEVIFIGIDKEIRLGNVDAKQDH